MVNASKRGEVFKCSVCGNIVNVLTVGGGELICCNQPMELMAEKISDTGMEKHIPVVTKDGDKVVVKVGSVEHPMEDAHFIEWVEVEANGITQRKFLNPGDKPEIVFQISGEIKARAYCNVHGLWKN
jgi:superoxide reductase